MIRKVTQHVQELSGAWAVRLVCGHRVYTGRDDHCRKVKARFCPACPGADRALMADQRNEIEEKMRKVVELSKPLAEHLNRFGKEPT